MTDPRQSMNVLQTWYGCSTDVVRAIRGLLRDNSAESTTEFLGICQISVVTSDVYPIEKMCTIVRLTPALLSSTLITPYLQRNLEEQASRKQKLSDINLRQARHAGSVADNVLARTKNLQGTELLLLTAGCFP